jgi:hypothetical protein
MGGKVIIKDHVVFTKTKQWIQSLAGAKLGSSGAGWTLGAAEDKFLATLSASATSEIVVVPITVPLKVGDIITAFSIVGQIESAGNGVTLDAALWKHTAAAADVTDTSIGGITQISVTADAIVSAEKSGLSEVVAADKSYFLVITGTTGASTDIALMGATVTTKES